MIIDNLVYIKISNRNITKYKKLGYECNIGDKIEVHISHIDKYSRVKVSCKCFFCSKIKKVEYRLYTSNILNGGIFSCSKKCSSNKSKKTNLERYGYESPIQSDIIKEKIKKTNLERYDVVNPFESEDIKNKIKKTLKEKWGVDHYSKTDDFKNKFIKTNLEKWGVDHYSKTDDFKNKFIKINLEKWGVSHPMKLDEFKDKVRKTNLEKWGVEFVLQSEEIKEKTKKTKFEKYGLENYNNIEKIKKTNLEKYGAINISQSEEKRKVNNKNCQDLNYIEYLGNNSSKYYCEQGHYYTITSDQYHSRKRNNINTCLICNPIGELKSIKENDLYKFIKSIYDNKVIQSYRDCLEIDIYLPDLNLGIEFNGLYWHSDNFKDKWYHINKTNYFKERGIRIIHIWEDDWDYNRDIIESQIKNWLGLTEGKIFARKCYVKEIKDSKIATKFLEENHIQGRVNSNLKLGLYHGKELVSLMTFDHYEGRKKMEDGGWNINRFCNKINYLVTGGASKLFKYFLNNYNVKRVISYADLDWSDGNLYEKLKFIKVSESKPDYKYIVEGVRVHKSRFRKSVTGISENRLNLLKTWNCGKIKYKIEL
jgi:hypothetical protein